MIRQPDTTNLGKEPESNIADMQLLLLLLLGCAVQCPNKKKFITGIKTLDLDTQLSIVDCIKQVTDEHDIVINEDCLDNVNMAGVFKQIKLLLQERDLYREVCISTSVASAIAEEISRRRKNDKKFFKKWNGTALNELSGASDSSVSGDGEDLKKIALSNLQTKMDREENHHFAVELADWKSKVRKQRQEL